MDEVGKMINGMIEYLNGTPVKGNKYKDRVEEPLPEYF
jgi:hypothetical protein